MTADIQQRILNRNHPPGRLRPIRPAVLASLRAVVGERTLALKRCEAASAAFNQLARACPVQSNPPSDTSWQPKSGAFASATWHLRSAYGEWDRAAEAAKGIFAQAIGDMLGIPPPRRSNKVLDCYFRTRNIEPWTPKAGQYLLDHTTAYRTIDRRGQATWKDAFVVTQPYHTRTEAKFSDYLARINADASCPFYAAELPCDLAWHAPQLTDRARIVLLYGRQCA